MYILPGSEYVVHETQIMGKIWNYPSIHLQVILSFKMYSIKAFLKLWELAVFAHLWRQEWSETVGWEVLESSEVKVRCKIYINWNSHTMTRKPFKLLPSDYNTAALFFLHMKVGGVGSWTTEQDSNDI